MAWFYLDMNSDGEYMNPSHLPATGMAFLAFDAMRWRIVLGYREHGGHMSFLEPHVNDDCNLVAFAPLSETGEPDLDEIRRRTPYHGPCYTTPPRLAFLR